MLHLNVTNVDQSLAFYKDVLGMELIAPVAAPRAGTGLVSDPGAMLKTAQLRVPGGTFEMEVVEWTGTALRPQQPRIQDPGEVMLAFNVRDFDAKLAGAKRLGLKVVSRNGEPYLSEGRGGRNRAIMLRDPSGFIVELTDITVNPTQNANAGPGGITSVGVWFTVQDLAKTVDFYNKVFGFTMMPPAAANPANDRIKGLFDNPAIATQRAARAMFPGTDFTINFQEFTGVDRKAVHHRVQDPGGPILLVQVTDFPAAIAAIKANGGTIGDGDTSVTLPADARASWTRDPNGVLIRVSPPAAPRAGGPAPRTN
jgi:catechol 2,3-dioxygenase-like lactoylglutathione lyase family enzyme